MKFGKKQIALITVLLGIALGIYSDDQKKSTKEKFTPSDGAIYKVSEVVDGDTFKIRENGKTSTVRMLGIDTPETKDPRKPEQCFGNEAWYETRRLIDNKDVLLQFEPNREKKDKYGRYLAFVFVQDKLSSTTLFVNEDLVERGFAKNYIYGKDHTYSEHFKQLENIAKDENRGMWGVCD